MSLFADAIAWLGDPASWAGPGGIGARIVEHLALSSAVVLGAALLGIPLGMLIGHTGRGRGAVVALTGGARALPTLGLLTLLGLSLGIGLQAPFLALLVLALPPVVAGRFFVYGAHDQGQVPTNVVDLKIDAGAAFGTGHHGTTVGCLIAFDDLLKREKFEKVLDVGCGTGVLAIAAARTGSRVAVGTDIDEPSVRIANENAELNHAKATFVHATGLNDIKVRQHGPYDLVFANILAPPLVALAQDIKMAMDVGGVAILSGLLRTQERRVTAAYLSRGFVVERRIHRDAWSALVLRRVA